MDNRPNRSGPAATFLQGCLLGGALALAVDAFLIEPARAGLSRLELPVPGLPAEWEGRRLVHLTDLHYGDPRSERLFRWMVATVNELEPDLIVITGDYVVRESNRAADSARHLKQLRSRFGLLGVLGDHDFGRNSREPLPGVVEAVTGSGVRLLRNDQVELEGGLRLAGVDPITHLMARGDLDEALRDADGSSPHLLLAHSPDVLPSASRRGVRVVLCGHTHGGQVVVPFYGPPITNTDVHRRHASGWSRYGETLAYTGRGLASHYSLRFLCRPEITLFTLRRDGPYRRGGARSEP